MEGCLLQRESDYWNSLVSKWPVGRQSLWRTHSDAINTALLKEWLPLGENGRVLKTDLFDEMCSEGLYPFFAPGTGSFIGMDLSFAAASGALFFNPGMAAVAADIRRLPFADSVFDTVISISTLDHFASLADIALSLCEIHRVLRQGGQMALTMDNFTNPVIALRNKLPFRLLNRLRVLPYRVGVTLDSLCLQQLLNQVGFAVGEQTTTIHCPRALAMALAHLLEISANARTKKVFLSCLAAFEKLSRWPTSHLTGHFIAARAIKR